MPHDFGGRQYEKASTHQLEWGTKLIAGLGLHKRLLDNVHRSLQPGGRLRFTFAGDGNCSAYFKVIREAMALDEFAPHFTGFEWPFYMPCVDEYPVLLEGGGRRDARVCGENADRYFLDQDAMIRWLDQPSLVPFLASVPLHDKAAFRAFGVPRAVSCERRNISAIIRATGSEGGQMRRRRGDHGRRLSHADHVEIQRRVTEGETFASAAAAVGCSTKSIQRFMARTGGLMPRARARAPLRLSLADREELSRGLQAGESFRQIAARLGRAVSTISREVAWNGHRATYRAWRAEQSGRPAGATTQAGEVGDLSPTVSVRRAAAPRALVAATDRGTARL